MCESPPRSDGGSPQGGSPIYPRSTFSSRMPGLESFFFHICCKVPMWSYQKAINLYWNSYIARLFSQLFDFTRIYPPGISSLFKKTNHTKQLLAPIRHHSCYIRWCQRKKPVVETPNLPHHIGPSSCRYSPIVDVSWHEGPTVQSSSVLHHSKANFARKGSWQGHPFLALETVF